MRGLLIKDLINLKKQYRVLLVMFVFYIVVSLTSGDNAFFGGVVSIMMVMLTVTSMSYDEYAKWDKYALTMPVSRRDLVLSKYLLGLLLSGAAFIINLLYQASMELPYKEVLGIAFSLAGVSILFISLVLPFLFKYGMEKGRLIMMMVLFIPTGIIMVGAKMIPKMGLTLPDPDVLNSLVYILPFVLLIAVAVSIMSSLRIYRNKEF